MVLSPKNTENALKTSINSCKTFIRTLPAVQPQHQKILAWFQELCALFTQTITEIGLKTPKSSLSIQHSLLLYLTQLLSSLSLLINILVKEEANGRALLPVRNCVIKQIQACFDGIADIIATNEPLVDQTGSFVRWMDEALVELAEIGDNGTETTRKCTEEVLAHAMSIAQVARALDAKIIRGGCQTVLGVLGDLEREIGSAPRNGAMVSLFSDSCCDKLCILERKVNTAVLRLCANVFAEFTKPLEKVRDFCFCRENKGKIDELDDLVADFDLHVDRIMQIGLFSVSCSCDVKRGIKTKSCLASLEALESELVPSLTAVLLENTENNVNSAEILMQHWIRQANCLKQLVFLIIDPFAFIQVINDETGEYVDKMAAILKQNGRLEVENVKELLLLGRVLRDFLNIARNELEETEIIKLKSKLKDFEDVLKEVGSASNFLLKLPTNCQENSQRVLKRCKILSTVIKRIFHCFADENVLENNKNADRIDEKSLSMNFKSFNIAPNIKQNGVGLLGNAFFDNIIKRGREILDERSVLYKPATPQKKNNTDFVPRNRPQMPMSRLVQLKRNLSFLKRENGNSELELDGILAEMTALSTTLL